MHFLEDGQGSLAGDRQPMRTFNIANILTVAILGAASTLSSSWSFAQSRGYYCENPRAYAPFLPLASDCKTGWRRLPTTPPPGRLGSDPSSCPMWTIDR